MRRLCVFCGSQAGKQPLYAQKARDFGSLLAQRGISLIYGAGNIGLMGVLADAVLQAKGEVIGVIPKSLVDREVAHAGLTELHIVNTMHERKALMADRADGFAALPGGYGTADEFFEILTWAQLGLHAKPIGLLNIAGYFDSLLEWLNHMIREGFLKPKHYRLLQIANQGEQLLDMLANYQAEQIEDKWIEPEDR
ncbi:MAG: TIGR00730 family Rossman fold protein [Gemmataceae bacterium]